MLNGLDLFSGIGGISLALREWVRPISYCEIDPYCISILLSRQKEGKLYKAPIWDDIRTLDATIFFKKIDIIYGGFPCQDISIAGYGKGLEGERSGLFFEILRIAKSTQSRFIFLENVPAITCRGGIQVINEIASLGYDCRWCIISADEYVDQKRERWFLLAKSSSLRCEKRACKDIQQKRKSGFDEKSCNYKLQSMEEWGTYSRSMRKDNGIRNKMDRIRALGNAVVPQQAKEAFKILMGLKETA